MCHFYTKHQKDSKTGGGGGGNLTRYNLVLLRIKRRRTITDN